MRRLGLLILFSAILPACAGCFGTMAKAFSDVKQHGNASEGVTFYIGGAGPIGHVGSIDVPMGLDDGGYKGYVYVYPWQGLSHAGDQMNLSRNRSKAMDLTDEIRKYHREYPRAKINIIALSAGTGIATFALEYLRESVSIENVFFLGCSLSAHYDMTRALRRVDGRLYVLHSQFDPILKKVVWYTGTVDRAPGDEGIAGMDGLLLPEHRGPDTEKQYSKIRNVQYRPDFASGGYEGGHTDSTKRAFVRQFIAPALMGNDRELIGEDEYRNEREQFFTTKARAERATTRPVAKPPAAAKNPPPPSDIAATKPPPAKPAPKPPTADSTPKRKPTNSSSALRPD